jgi:hypothetical protein
LNKSVLLEDAFDEPLEAFRDPFSRHCVAILDFIFERGLSKCEGGGDVGLSDHRVVPVVQIDEDW